MKQVLILCTGNSCRSQMAETIWNQLGEGEWKADSAGSKPAGYVHPLAIEAMKELEADLSTATSKHVDLFNDQPIDLVVTVCDNAKEACPAFPGANETLHWPFDDPADATGSDEEKMQCFRRVRDEIRQRITEYLS
jgi:arsenate reductase